MLWLVGGGAIDDRVVTAQAAVELLGPALADLVAEAVATVGPSHAAVTRLVTERIRQGRPEDQAALAAIRALKAFDLRAKMVAEGWALDAAYPGGWRPPEGADPSLREDDEA
jgi:hypothetical protein